MTNRLERKTGPMHLLVACIVAILAATPGLAQSTPDAVALAAAREKWQGWKLTPQFGHSSYVASISFSPDGRRIVSGGRDATIKVWDIDTGRLQRTITTNWVNGVETIAFMPDGRRVIANGDSWGVIKIWDVDSGRLIRTLDTSSDYVVTRAALSPTGTRVAVGGLIDLAGHERVPTIYIWDVDTGGLVRKLMGHSKSVTSVAFSSDGLRIASASADKTVKIWDAASGRLLRTLSGHSGEVISVCFSPDSKTIASIANDETVKIWNVDTGALVRTLPGQRKYGRVIYSPDGRYLVADGADNTIKIWTAGGDRLLLTLKGYSSPIAFSPDGRRIAVRDAGGFKILSADSGNTIRAIANHEFQYTSVAISPDSRFIISGTESTGVLMVWDARNGALLRTIQGHSSSVTSITFFPGGRRFASVSDSK